MTLAAGQSLSFYEILGAGGMGEVYRARDTRLERFKTADEDSFQFEMENQRNWNELLVGIQEVQ